MSDVAPDPDAPKMHIILDSIILGRRSEKKLKPSLNGCGDSLPPLMAYKEAAGLARPVAWTPLWEHS
jgi:hypothetical protein